MIAVVDKSENHGYLCSVLGMGMGMGMRTANGNANAREIIKNHIEPQLTAELRMSAPTATATPAPATAPTETATLPLSLLLVASKVT